LWRQYNSALLQQYVARQKEAASAPLEQQIAELTRLSNDQQAELKTLHEQMDANATAAAQAKTDGHSQGMQQGASYGVTGTLLLVGILFAIKRATSGYTLTKKDQAKAASA
jgi:flagellar biosynthesis/type III secretory pathway protein FliH